MIDGLQKLIAGLETKAAETGKVMRATVSSDGWEPVMSDGKQIGKVKFDNLVVTVVPVQRKLSPYRDEPAFIEGMETYKAGLGREACPYSPAVKSVAALFEERDYPGWQDGWEEAEIQEIIND